MCVVFPAISRIDYASLCKRWPGLKTLHRKGAQRLRDDRRRHVEQEWHAAWDAFQVEQQSRGCVG